MMALWARVDLLLGSSSVVTAAVVLSPYLSLEMGGVPLVEGVAGASCAESGMGPVESDSGGIASPLT